MKYIEYMEYYHLMILLGGLILYMLLNIYPIIVYLTEIIKKRDLKELLNMPFVIIMLLIPILGSIHGLLIVEYIVGFEKKWHLIAGYTGMYLLLFGFIITLVVAFNV